MKFAVEVPVRWSDMDAYGHVNHARVVTLLEDARTELLFREMPRRGYGQINDGMVVYKLAVEYRTPLVYTDSPIRVEIWVTEVRASAFVLRYAVPGPVGRRAQVVAETTMVPYDLAGNGPRRVSTELREFLALWTAEEDAASA